MPSPDGFRISKRWTQGGVTRWIVQWDNFERHFSSKRDAERFVRNMEANEPEHRHPGASRGHKSISETNAGYGDLLD